ncbi:hypothetical protein DKX38_011785 [Salix brachista]|uniref:Uncharacterized protein n=1 Tax=Salix brachista TaxID=2182728 RepID=A0A5N5LZX1_9ROSI|nr:hypothetical protein DKX38_011785 [Salix brachista]
MVDLAVDSLYGIERKVAAGFLNAHGLTGGDITGSVDEIEALKEKENEEDADWQLKRSGSLSMGTVELYRQVDADIDDENLHPGMLTKNTPDAWEKLRSGVQRLLVYPSKVCEHCSEVQIGFDYPSKV